MYANYDLTRPVLAGHRQAYPAFQLKQPFPESHEVRDPSEDNMESVQDGSAKLEDVVGSIACEAMKRNRTHTPWRSCVPKLHLAHLSSLYSCVFNEAGHHAYKVRLMQRALTR